MTVTAYFRFSTREQAEGTSIQRQREDCQRFATDQGWTIDEQISDEGKSAFSGANREDGAALRQYEDEARAGLRHGDTLIVERLDRISRQGYDETSDFVKLLTRAGVTVATVDGAEIYEAGKKLDTFQVIKMLLKAEVAHEESVKKSQRLRRRYEVDRAAARISGVALTKNLPAWLKKGRDGKPKVRDHRDAVIRRIFELADGGAGALTITRTINAEFEPWLGLNGQTTMQWNRSRVDRILRDRQVTGEYQPYSTENGQRVPAGDPWPDYFPRIIPQDLFDRVQAAAGLRQSPAGKRSTTVANLFAGMLKCAACGSWMLFERKRVAGTPYHGGRHRVVHDESSLKCSKAHYGKGCANNATISYYGFERAMLDTCLHLALDSRTFADRDELSRIMGELAEARRTHEIALTTARALWQGYAKTTSDMAMEAARQAEDEAKSLEGGIADLEARASVAAGKADAEAHLSRIAEFRRHLYDDDLDVRARHRTKVAQGFRSIIEAVTFDAERVARVQMVGDARWIKIKRGKVLRNWNMLKPGREHVGATAEKTVAIRNIERRGREAA